jgi:phosphate starvation-inducible protein PhoH
MSDFFAILPESGHITNAADFSDISTYQKKRGGKRNKKQIEKEIYKEWNKEKDQDRGERKDKSPQTIPVLLQQRKYYQNMQYLSKPEKEQFEAKFCKPRNPGQKRLSIQLHDATKKIVIATGPAGTGKTLFTAQTAIRNFLLGNCDKIIFTRPSVTVDEELGFLPGTLEEKMAPWMRPLYDILYQHISPKEVQHLIEEKVIEICPLGFMRGRTFKNCQIVADEMQNCTQTQMKMLLTRIGENTRLFVTGDLEQCDRHGERNGLEDFLDKIHGRRSNSISSVEFEVKDVEREDVVKEVLDIYTLCSISVKSESSESMGGSETGSEMGSETDMDSETKKYQEGGDGDEDAASVEA